jgi:hypothetical protein
MIVETIFSTLDQNGKPNFAPMGLVWGDKFVIVRPYRDTQTCRNLFSGRYGVANVCDDILAYVQCALYDAILPHFPAQAGSGVIFSNACFWREVEAVSFGGTTERAEVRCQVIAEGQKRQFLGFRRASNAVIEAAIVATRLNIYNHGTLTEKMAQYEDIVKKTGDDADRQAFQMVRDYIQRGTE